MSSPTQCPKSDEHDRHILYRISKQRNWSNAALLSSSVTSINCHIRNAKILRSTQPRNTSTTNRFNLVLQYHFGLVDLQFDDF